MRVLSCAIEQIADWHSHLYLEPHIVAFVAVAKQYSSSPAEIEVECTGIASSWLGKATVFQVEVAWHNDTVAKAERLLATMQAAPLVELAAVALAMIICHRVVSLGRLDVTLFGDRADYRARRRKVVLEVSGTEVVGELPRRHRAKIVQACGNPFGWDAYVFVCAFAATAHVALFSKHPPKESKHGQTTD